MVPWRWPTGPSRPDARGGVTLSEPREHERPRNGPPARGPTGDAGPADPRSPEPYETIAEHLDRGAELRGDPLADPEAGEIALDVGDTADDIAVHATSGAEAVVGRWQTPFGRFLRTALALGAFFLIAGFIWEALKWFAGTPWRMEDILGTGADYYHDPPFRVLQFSDRQLPHIWDIGYQLFEPFQRGSDETLLGFLLGAALFTLRQAVIGFVLGAFIGIAIASVFVHSVRSERAFMPYVVATQTIPIVALAPVIALAVGLGPAAVVIVATYLTFFPVAIAQLRGLRSPDPRALELMRSYGASRWDIYRKLRLPASVPFLFTALKVAATWAIIGAIIGEGPGGVGQGLGKAIISFSQQYITGPEKLWATILIASLVGIVAYLAVRAVEVFVVRHRPGARS
jgi:NitT/TauT family transport system permease protein